MATTPSDDSQQLPPYYYDQQRDAEQAGLLDIALQSAQQRWDSDKLLDALARFDLPYFLAQSDPRNTVMIDAARQEELDTQFDLHSIAYEIPAPETYPALTALLKEYTRKQNHLFKKDYPPPAVVIVDHYADNNGGSPAAFNPRGDMLYIDKDALPGLLADLPSLKATIAHELGHRHERDDPSLLLAAVRADLSARYHRDRSAALLKEARISETMADYRGAQLASPELMERVVGVPLDTTFDEYMFERYQQLMSGKTLPASVTLKDWKEGLSDQDYEQLREAHAQLPVSEQNALYNRLLDRIDKAEPTLDHASPRHRARFMELLEGHRDLLKSSTQIVLDDADHIASVTEHGRPLPERTIKKFNDFLSSPQ